MSTLETAWPDTLFSTLLEGGIRTVAYVPDAGHARAIELADAEPSITTVSLTTEEEGIGYLAGAWLGGLRGVLLMQSSGVGNCINTLALAAQGAFPAADARDDAGRVGRAESLAEPRGQGRRAERLG